MSTDWEKRFIEYGLVNIHDYDPEIKIDLKYASENNFMRKNVYGNLNKAFLLPGIAERIIMAKQFLKNIRPDCNFIIYDAARPISIQRYMFSLVEGTSQEPYVASPASSGGFHNYGLAVDLSIIDNKNNTLDMGTPYDYFGTLAHPGKESEWLQKGLINQNVYENRTLLYDIMERAGMYPHPNEWWHYQHHLQENDKLNFKLLDF